MAATSEPATGGTFDVRVAWRRDDPRIEADAIAMWTRLGILAEGVKPEERAKQLVSAAYCGDQIAAVATAVVEHVSFLKNRFLVLRSMTVPEFRRSHAQVALGIPSITALTDWAKANPQEKVAGMIAFVEPGAWGEAARMPRGPFFGWTLVAYSQRGHQVRVIWFDHFRLD